MVIDKVHDTQSFLFNSEVKGMSVSSVKEEKKKQDKKREEKPEKKLKTLRFLFFPLNIAS